MVPQGGGFWDLVRVASPFAQLILVILAVMSLISWAIILEKVLLVLRTKSDSAAISRYRWRQFDPRGLFQIAKQYSSSPMAWAYMQIYSPFFERGATAGHDAELVGREFGRMAARKLSHAERYLPFLATCSAAGPFLGLLGTVWGIISAFQRIGVWGSANIAVVAPGIAEALVATAVGLGAAIPALVAYNLFSSWIRKEAGRVEDFGEDLIYAVGRWSEQQTQIEPSAGQHYEKI
jgi:biopolymer transport protein TolQ